MFRWKQWSGPLLLAILAFSLLFCARLEAGDLTPPPGPITPTMKTLDQLEPRVPIPAAAGPIAFPITINESGSYYLTQNLTGASGEHGIVIAADNVTIDLCGFRLAGAPGSLNGIHVPTQRIGLWVKNGSVVGWGGHGVNGFQAAQSSFSNLFLSDNGDAGLRMQGSCVVTHCSARNNSGIGIEAVGGRSSVSYSVAENNGGTGICVGSTSSVSQSIAGGNTNGIEVGDASLVESCTAQFNSLAGVKAANGCVVRTSTCNSNATGIEAGDGCYIRDNLCRLNSQSGFNFGQESRIVGNTSALNLTGYLTIGFGSLIIRNFANFNGTNFDVSGANLFADVIASQTDLNSNTNPNANFALD